VKASSEAMRAIVSVSQAAFSYRPAVVVTEEEVKAGPGLDDRAERVARATEMLFRPDPVVVSFGLVKLKALCSQEAAKKLDAVKTAVDAEKAQPDGLPTRLLIWAEEVKEICCYHPPSKKLRAD
jgi:dienelactone hydrolase